MKSFKRFYNIRCTKSIKIKDLDVYNRRLVIGHPVHNNQISQCACMLPTYTKYNVPLIRLCRPVPVEGVN